MNLERTERGESSVTSGEFKKKRDKNWGAKEGLKSEYLLLGNELVGEKGSGRG